VQENLKPFIMKKKLRKTSLVVLLAIFGLINNTNAQWTKVTDLTQKAGYNITITVFGVNNGSIYIADDWNRTTSRSDDNGKTWTMIYQNMLSSMIFTGSNIYAFDYSGVYLSSDKGANWKTISNTSVKNILCIALVGTTLYVGVADQGVYMTTDDGTNWALLSNGFNGTATQHSVFFISSGNGKLYASTNYGIYGSSDNGSNWSALTAAAWPSSAGRSTTAGVSTVNGSNIFAKASGFPTSELYVSTNAGAAWTKANTAEVPSVMFLQGNSVIIGSANGAFSSTDFGANWTDERSSDFVSGKKNVTSLISDGTYIYAGTGSDLWKRPISEFSLTGTEVKQAGMSESLYIYPNPTNGKVFISWNHNSTASMQIINIQGKVVINKQIAKQTCIDLPGQGIYFVKLIDGTNSYSKKIMVQ
jgi:hypothetical protein